MRDLTGQVFGRLTVIGLAQPKNGRRYWLCRCECGNEKAIEGTSLVRGKSQSCGCTRHEKLKDMTGQVFGKLTVIGYEGSKDDNSLWRCRCECGKETVVSRSALLSGSTTSCGEFKCGAWRAKEEVDRSIIGKRFGRLVVVDFVEMRGRRISYWKCRCDCGNEKIVSRNSLRNGKTRSCGCLRREMIKGIEPGVGRYVLPELERRDEGGVS